MSSNLKVNTILPSVGSNIGLGTNGGNLNVDGGCKVQVGTALTLGHTVGVQFATQNLHSAGFEVNQINASGIITASHFYGNGSNLTGITQTTINNNANNRVITGSGTANTLEAESNLTFTGSILTVTNSSGASELTLVTPSNTDGGVYFNDGSNSGALSYNHSDDSMRFRVNATEKLRITSSGALGTKSTVRSANGGLDLCAQGATNLGTLTLGAGGGQNGQSRNNNQENQFRIMMPTYANPSNMTTVLYGTSGSAGHDLHYGGGTGWAYATNTHRFFTTANQTTGTGTERLRILSSGNVGIGTDNPQYLDANFRELTISGGSEGAGLHLQDDNANVVGGFFTSDNTNAMIIRTRSNHPMIFRTNNTERLRIGSDGTTSLAQSCNLYGTLGNSQIVGLFGSKTTGGTTDWNHVTNARSGNGYTLLLGSHSNGPGGSQYFHVICFEYSTKNGSGNMTQLAIPYTSGTIYSRYRYSGSWSGWSSH